MSLAAIAFPTFSKNEKYIDSGIDVIDAFWPTHPEIWVLTDKGEFKYEKCVIVKSPHWTGVVLGGIEGLLDKKVLSVDDYVLLVHEDMIPIAPVQGKLINSIAYYANQKQLKYVCLCGGFGIGDKVCEIDGASLFVIRENWRYYSGHHPAIWNVGYLKDNMRRAISLGYLDQWRSEYVRDANVLHYAVGVGLEFFHIWPMTFAGFLKTGRVNIEALKQMKSPALRPLKKMLIRDYITQLPGYICYKIKGKINTIVSAVTSKRLRKC